MAVERWLLQHSKNGDRILLGFAGRNEALAVEHIRKMANGGARDLKVLFAKGLERSTGTAYDYMTKRTGTTSMHDVGGSYILLRCTRDLVSPAELLQPAFDLGEKLPGEGLRVFYHTGWRHIFYHTHGTGGEWFEVAEPRLKAGRDILTGPTGTFYPDCIYPDCTKLLAAMERLSHPVESAGDESVREVVMKEAYYAYERSGQLNQDLNWRNAQMRQVVLIAHWLNGMKKNQDNEMRLSGIVDTGDVATSTLVMGTEHLDVRTARLVLSQLKGDDSIHLKPTIIPYGPYINGLLASNR